MKTFYDVLGVSPSAAPEVVKAAYRALLRANHPDVSSRPDAEKRTREITEAYDTLGDPQRRAAYDRTLAVRERPGSDVDSPGRRSSASAAPPPALTRAPRPSPGSESTDPDPSSMAYRFGPVEWAGLATLVLALAAAAGVLLSNGDVTWTIVVAALMLLSLTGRGWWAWAGLGALAAVTVASFLWPNGPWFSTLTVLGTIGVVLTRHVAVPRWRRHRSAQCWAGLLILRSQNPGSRIARVLNVEPTTGATCTALLDVLGEETIVVTLWDTPVIGMWVLIDAVGRIVATAPDDAQQMWQRRAR